MAKEIPAPQLLPGERPVKFAFFQHALPCSGRTSLALGNDFSTGGSLSGLVKLIAQSPTGLLRVVIEDIQSGRLGEVTFSSYLYTELLDPEPTGAKKAA